MGWGFGESSGTFHLNPHYSALLQTDQVCRVSVAILQSLSTVILLEDALQAAEIPVVGHAASVRDLPRQVDEPLPGNALIACQQIAKNHDGNLRKDKSILKTYKILVVSSDLR